MKTTLPERSSNIEGRLYNIVKTILETAENKIAMVILYGSYARGDWVTDISNNYQSDLDILIVLKKAKYMGRDSMKLQDSLEKKLELKSKSDRATKPSVSIIIEPISRVNQEIEKGQYFFCDIVKEGILLHDSGEFNLSEARKLPWPERREIAQKYYNNWFESAISFLFYCNHALERNDFKKSAFFLHQATESFYNAILLVFDGYKPRTHDIEKLNQYCRAYSNNIHNIFPVDTVEQEECFKLLKDAYVDARYNMEYKISKEQLIYLIQRVEELKALTEEICLEKLNS